MSGSMPVARGLGAPSIALDAAGLIDEDIPCRRCGYNLKTLSPESKCPECGTSVSRSIHGDLLRFADPDWVRKLATGTLTTMIGACLAIMGWLVFTAMVFVGLSVLQWGRTIWILCWIVGAAGIWIITTPDPGTSDTTSDRGTGRLLTRVSLTLSLCLIIANSYRDMMDSLISHFLAAVGYGNDALYAIALFTFARSLATRIPNEKLARSCSWLMYFLVADTIVNAGVWVIFTLILGEFPANLLAIYNVLPFLVSLIGFLWSVWLLVRFRKAFKNAYTLAQDAWTDGQSTPRAALDQSTTAIP